MVTDTVSVLVYSLMLIALFAGVESQGREPPNTGLYFTLRGTVYLPGDTILITDIGSENTNNRSDPQSSLVCVTTNVNIQCCSGADNPNGGGRGEWYLPDGSRLLYTTDNNFYRSRYTQQVRLYRSKGAMSPTGVFTCVVPNITNHNATITIATQLNVALTESGGTPMAGLNYTLTCKASGGEPMALHTYMWLRNDSVVSSQTSSTYSFSPLLVVHSGQYNCRVSAGSMNVTSRSVNITVVATTTQLYFTWRGNRYEPGDSVLITDVGLHVTSDNNIGPGDSLVCVTTNVNTQCCTDVGGVGEWFLPNGSMVIRNIDDTKRNTQIIRTGRANQVRLNFRRNQTSPTGEYTCVVPVTDGSVIQTAGIRLVTVLPQLNVTLTRSGMPTEGQNYMLACTVSGGGSMAYNYKWLKDGSVVPSQNSSTYSFSPLLVADSGQYSCQVTVGFMTMNTSGVVSITVVELPVTTNPSTSPTTTAIVTTAMSTTMTTTPPTAPTTLTTSTTPTTMPPTTMPPTTMPPTTMPPTTTPTTITVRTSTTMAAPTATTQMSPLTVVVVSNGNVLSAGQNHTLTCEVSGGGSMAYTYTWLKDGNVVSGQTSSTYFLSPLLVVHSGQYSCRVSDGSMTMTSGNVTITVGISTGLYFTLSGTVYLPGDTILITDIGSNTTGNRSDPQSSLVCVTTNVNTNCCRGADNPNGGGRGEWYLPDGTRLLYTPDDNFYRARYIQQVRLYRRNGAISPTGVFTCAVLNNSMNHTATIRIATALPQLNVMLTGSGDTVAEGQNYTLTCAASGGGSMAYTYMWLKDGSVVSGQTSSTYYFFPLRMTDSGRYNCLVSLGYTNMTSEAVTITVVALPTTTGATVPSASTTTITTTSITTTTISPLTVRIVSSGGTLRAGQNHVLTCEASGGGSMAYTYMWLKDGSVVSGKTSSTYSFTSLEVADSGQYSCRVSVDSMTEASEDVDITVLGTLYFTLRGNRYEPDDSILITDIGLHAGDAGPEHSLVCVTTYVNTQCCTDRGGVGEWLFPNGSVVIRNIDDPNRNSQIVRTGRANQVRLNFRTPQTSPIGEYTCVVPVTGGSMNKTAGIRLVKELPPLNVMLVGSGGTLTEGQIHVLTCTASGGGSMAYIYEWRRNSSVVPGQNSSTYSFSPLLVADSGIYSCQVTVGSMTMNTSGVVSITVIDAVPNPPSNLTATMHTATSITITWTETTTTNIDRYEVTYSYTVMRCSAPAGPVMTNTVTSTSRSHTLMNLNEDSTYTITVRSIKGAASNMATITANTATAVPSAGPSSVTPTTVGTTSITIEWSELDCTDRNRVITGYKIRYGPTSTTPSQRQIATISNPGRRMFTVDREFITHSYDFEVAAINVDGTGPYSTPLTVDTAVPTGLGFYLNGMTYSNNSVLTITDIGEGDMSLYCITERSECCRSSDGGERGDWFLPGQDSAVEGTSTGDFSRRREPRAVVLDRRNNAIVPIGLYRCEVPDAGNTIQSLYIGVYTNDRGRPSVSLVSYSHTSQSLNCTSSGGPATNVTWRKDNIIIPLTSSTYQQSQTVANEVTSTYHNLLFITSSSVEDHRGSFSCTIGNDRGSSENYLLVINKIEISGNQSIYQLGSSHRITCSSDLTVQSIQWLDTSDNGEILTSNTGEQQLVLEIDDITAAINNTMYTCEVTLTLQTTLVMETIHLVVSNANFPRHPKSVIVTATTPTGVYIQWMLTEPFNATRPETFVVLYGTTQNGLTRTSTSMVIATATSQTYSIQLNSLDIGTQYYFQVQSRNRFGSIVSNVMDFTTDDTMSGPVMDLKTYSPDNSTLVISWRPPSTPNGNIISYTVRIENLRDGTTLRDIADLNAVTTSLTEDGLSNVISGLRFNIGVHFLVPGVPYRVSFIAVNRAGQGNITVLTNFTKELEPNHPPKDVKVDRIHPTVMVVTWIPLTLPEARGFITSYTVFYSPQVSRGKRQEHHTMQKAVSGNVNQTTINGLDPNTAYDVQMSANTTAGASALSEVISAQVPSDTGGLSIVVIVVALVVVLALILIIILLVLLVLKMRWTVRTRNTESVEFQTHNIDDQSGIYEVIDEEWKEEIFSEIKSPSSTNKVNNQSKVEELTMTQCPAYAPVTSLTINCRR